jgi:GNAT superfamily N-acetyltransferase
MVGTIQIVRFTEIVAGTRPTVASVRADIDAIFFETAPRAPADPSARATFYDLWLGQYLRHEPHLAHVAIKDGRVVGYLVACHTNPATLPRFETLAYFKTFAAVCALFPAHLHINLTEAARGSGTGARLVQACCTDAASAGLPGVHVVTAATARNVRFYQRIGFREVAATERNGARILCLGHALR